MLGFDKIKFYPSDDTFRFLTITDHLIQENDQLERKRIVDIVKKAIDFEEPVYEALSEIENGDSYDERYAIFERVFHKIVKDNIKNDIKIGKDAFEIVIDDQKFVEMEEWFNGSVAKSEVSV